MQLGKPHSEQDQEGQSAGRGNRPSAARARFPGRSQEPTGNGGPQMDGHRQTKSGLQAGSSPIDWARGAVQVRGGILLGVAQLVHTLQRGPDDRMVSCEEQ